MAYGHTFQELKEKTRDELIEYYDSTRKTGETNHIILHELRRRENIEHQEAIETMTRTMKNLTWVIVGLTVVNVVLVWVSSI